MFRRILIANRGEIAMRLIRCMKEMEIESVLAYSSEDADSLPVQMATEAVCIGPAAASASYLNQAALVEAARLLAVTRFIRDTDFCLRMQISRHLSGKTAWPSSVLILKPSV